MKNIKIILLIIFSVIILFGIVITAHATLNVDTEVNVPEICSVADTDGVTHNYGEVNQYLAICALYSAINNGSIFNTQLSNQYPNLGLFVIAINNVVADPNSQYWAIYQNGNFANSGITSLPVIAGDTIMFQLHDFSDNNQGDQVTLHIHSLGAPTPMGSGALIQSTNTTSLETLDIVPEKIIKPIFDTKKAFDFLISQQKEDGSWSTDLYTDWSALAIEPNENLQEQKNKLGTYLKENKLSNISLTDYERHVMALMALGINPYKLNGENYVDKIIKEFDGNQFGNKDEDNDDIFALIILQNAGFGKNEEIINNTSNFILSKQKENGSWDENPDMTGAGIESLAFLKENEQIKNALEKAKEYLKQNQKDDGGFGNISSTAWAIEGIISLGEKVENWKKNDNTPIDYLAQNQDQDGGIKNENKDTKLWETIYVLSAISGHSWTEIMQKFGKPIMEQKVEIIEEKIPVNLSYGKNITETKKIVTKQNIPNVAKTTIIENLGTINTASVINATTNTNVKTKNTESSLQRFLGKIFEMFF